MTTDIMRAIVVRDDEDKTLDWAAVPKPSAGPGQVLVRVRATAVNRADLLQRIGLYPVPEGATEIMGLEASGTIIEVGEGVDPSRVGEDVCMLLEGGGYAELVDVDESMLLPMPEGLSHAEAAALPEVFYTAFLNIWLEGDCKPGEAVLIHAAGSGVGTAAVQLCKAFGNPCIGTMSASKLEVVRQLGCDIVVDRNVQNFVDVVKRETKAGVDVILDPVGASYLEDNLRALAPRGRLVNIGLLGGAKAQIDMRRMLLRRLRVIGSVLRSRSRAEKVDITAAIKERVWPLFCKSADGEAPALKPVVHTSISIERAAEAHALLKSNATIGKVVMTIPERE